MYVIYLRKEMLSALKFQNKARLFIICYFGAAGLLHVRECSVLSFRFVSLLLSRVFLA